MTPESRRLAGILLIVYPAALYGGSDLAQRGIYLAYAGALILIRPRSPVP